MLVGAADERFHSDSAEARYRLSLRRSFDIERANVRLVLTLRCEDPCCGAEDRGDEKSNKGCPAASVSECSREIAQRTHTRSPLCVYVGKSIGCVEAATRQCGDAGLAWSSNAMTPVALRQVLGALDLI